MQKAPMPMSMSMCPSPSPSANGNFGISISPRIIGPMPVTAQPFASSATSVADFVSAPRRYSIFTVSPGSRSWASSIKRCPGADSSESRSSEPPPVSDLPLNRVMISPDLSPALSAGPPGVTPSIRAPTLSDESATVLTSTPMRPRLPLNLKVYARPSGRGVRARGGGAGCCAASGNWATPARASAVKIQVRFMIPLCLGPSEAHVLGAGDVHLQELLHQVYPLPPEIYEMRVGARRIAQPRQLPIEDRVLILELRREIGLATAHHARIGIVVAQRRFELRRLLLRLRQILAQGRRRVDRTNDDDSDDRRRHGQAAAHPPLPPPRTLGLDCITNRGSAVTRWTQRGKRFELRHTLVQPLPLGLALGTLFHVPARPHRALAVPQRDQIFNRAMHSQTLQFNRRPRPATAGAAGAHAPGPAATSRNSPCDPSAPRSPRA